MDIYNTNLHLLPHVSYIAMYALQFKRLQLVFHISTEWYEATLIVKALHYTFKSSRRVDCLYPTGRDTKTHNKAQLTDGFWYKQTLKRIFHSCQLCEMEKITSVRMELITGTWMVELGWLTPISVNHMGWNVCISGRIHDWWWWWWHSMLFHTQRDANTRSITDDLLNGNVFFGSVECMLFEHVFNYMYLEYICVCVCVCMCTVWVWCMDVVYINDM